MKLKALRIMKCMKCMFLSIFLAAGMSGNGFAQDPEIFEAIKIHDTAKVRNLLVARPSLVHSRKQQSTPLHYAAALGHNDIVKLLVSNGANVNAQDKVGNTPLYYASLDGHTEAVRLLAAKSNINSRNYSLIAASHGGYSETVRALLAAKSNVNIQASGNETALLVACGCYYVGRNGYEYEYVNTVRFLINAGANVNVKSSYSRRETPLIRAVRQGCPAEVVRILLVAGADVTARDSDGTDAVAYKTTPEIAQILQVALGKQKGVSTQSHPSYQSNSSSQDQPKYYNVIYICRWARSDTIWDIKSGEMTTFAQGEDEIDAGYKGIGEFEVRERCKAMAKSNGGFNGEPIFKRASLVR